MNSFVVLSFVAVAVIVSALEEHGPAHYKFAYGVDDHHTGDHHQQHEVRDGHVVKGSYSLEEADGTRRVVEYVAGPHTGFNAIVKRLGHAHHPQRYAIWRHGEQNSDDRDGQEGAYGHWNADSYVGTTHWGYNY